MEKKTKKKHSADLHVKRARTGTNKILEEYNKRQLAWKARIRMEPSKGKRFWMWCGYLIAFPGYWVFFNIRDWRTAVIFVLVFIALSSEVGVPYLLGIIFSNAGLIGVGTACWLFGLGPGTPFMVICIIATIGVKTLWNKITKKNSD